MMNSSLRFVNRLNSYCRRHVLKTVISKQPVRLLCTAIPEPHIDGQNENNRPRLVQLVEDIKKLTPVEVKDLNDLLKTNSNLRIDSSEPKKPRESREPREPRERIKDNSCVVRIRGLPYSATAEGVLEFFEGSNICGGESGIHLTQDDQGRPSGEAFIEFESPEDVETAMRKHNADMDSRYIEVYRSNQNELDSIDCIVQLRGLPFSSDEEEIAAFFDGLEIVPNGIILKKTRQGRNSGKAYVQFANPANADRSLCKHKETMGHRYIEIFRATVSEAQIAREQNKDQEY